MARSADKCSMFWICLSSCLFVEFHFFPMPNLLDKLPGRARQPGAFKVFRNVHFLGQVLLLDIILVLLYYSDGSIWPCTIVHWAAVVVMQFGYGYDQKLKDQEDHHEIEEPSDDDTSVELGEGILPQGENFSSLGWSAGNS